MSSENEEQTGESGAPSLTHYLPNSSTLLPSVAPEPVRKLLAAATWETDAGSLAVDTVQTQLAHHETRRRISRTRVEQPQVVPSLFDVAVGTFARSVGEGEVHELEALPPGVRSRVIWELVNMPYDFFRKLHIPENHEERDMDEWVLHNEIWIRDSATAAEAQDVGSYKRTRGEDGEFIAQNAEKPPWTGGLVKFSAHSDVVFSGSTLTDTCRIITRKDSESLQGFKILDGRRLAQVRIQPSVAAFAKTFEAMTGGLLKGLNWDHVFVAGGIILGTLLCTEDKDATNTPDQWMNSDVDLYIHGLGPVEANKKIEHIFDVFKANLPKDAPVLLVRNSKTITFFSKYPLRRIQVVLKLVNSPRDVLLNFDLDICAIGWDGNEVWMLPRAARALETGYTVFTMDLINGHYLGDRRATQEQRVFKYADKGYGIRILPPYLNELELIVNDLEKQTALGINRNQETTWNRWNKDWDLRALDDLADAARAWTTKVVKGNPYLQNITVPSMSHAQLQERSQTNEEPPGRSALSSFSLLMRHVALWEKEVAGELVIEKDLWAASTYDNIYVNDYGVGYNDTPDYSWDRNFTIEGFVSNMNGFNDNERQTLAHSLWERFETDRSFFTFKVDRPLDKFLVEGFRLQRITHANSVQEILEPDHDIYLPVWLPDKFIEFADDLIPDMVRKSGVPDYSTKAFVPALKDNASFDSLRLVFWRITSVTMWQQLSRTIDEVHEVLWSFHHANAAHHIDEGGRLNLLVSQFAKRAIRMTAQDENGAFARWVARQPEPVSTNYNGNFEGLIGGSSEEDEHEDGDE